ncbi:SdrD B-like domain-containing protein [Schumannella luteola]
MNYSNSADVLTIGRSRLAARWGVIAAIAAMLAVLFSGLTGVQSASAAAGFTVVTDFDGTGQGTSSACPIVGPGGDNTLNDRVVCTNDLVGYRWQYDVPSGEGATITFTATLEAGYVWEDSNTASCQSQPGPLGYTASGGISNGGLTFTCTLVFQSNPAGRGGGFVATARVGASVPDGSIMDPTFTVNRGSGVEPLDTAPVTVRSRAQVDLIKDMDIYQYPVVFNGQAGAMVIVNVAGVQQGSVGLKGIAALANSFSFTDDLSGMPDGTVLVTSGNCRMEPGGGEWNVGSAPGTWDCQQPGGAGSEVSITVTGADTGGSGYHTSPAGGHTVFAGSYRLFFPSSSIPEAGIEAEDQLRGFDPDTVNGAASNYGTATDRSGFEPGGYVTDTCDDPAQNNNCDSVFIPGQVSGTLTTFKDLASASKGSLPSHGSTGALLVPGQDFLAKLVTIVPAGGADGLVLCDVFDPTLEQVDPDRGMEVNLTGGAGPLPSYTIEYSTQPIADVNSASCGVAGDPNTNGPWYSSVAAAGGAANVTSLRLVLSGTVPEGSFDWWIPMTNVSNTPGAQSSDTLWVSTGGVPFEFRDRETYTVTQNILSLVKTSNGQFVGSARPGDTLPFHLQPTLSFPATGGDPVVLTVTDNLPVCYLNPVLTGATAANWTMAVTPGNPGPDGIPCTGDAESGAVLTFTSTTALNPNQPVPSIDYQITSSTRTPIGPENRQQNFAVVSSTGNAQPVDQRYATALYEFVAAIQVSVVKSVDASPVEVAPDQIGFAIEWANNMNRSVGETTWIDVLPYNGDGRGTNFHGTVSLSGVQLTSSDAVVVSLTSRDPDLLDRNPNAASNQPGGDTVWCTVDQVTSAAPGCPAMGDVTAIRVTHLTLDAGDFGRLHFTMQPVGNMEGDVYQNHTERGVSEELDLLGVPESNQVLVEVLASTIGDTVWWDLDRDGVQDAGENGIPNVTLNLLDSVGNVIATTVTDASGLYHFGDYHSGTYQVVVDASTLPFADVITPTYDLDNGITGPNGNSGQFPLGVDTDRTDVDFGFALPPTTADRFFTTAVSPQAVPATGSISDRVTFSGDILPGEYTWTLYGPVADNAGSCVGLDWSGADIVDSDSFLVTAGQAPVDTPAIGLDEVGCYTYVGSYAIDGYPGSPFVDGPGIPSETALVSASVPSVGTVASTTSNRPGADAQDAVTISGLTSDSVYHWTLYGPLAPVGGTCDAVDWTGAPPVVQGDSFPVTPAQTEYSTPAVTVDEVGCYTYGGQLDATATTTAVPLALGVPAESFQISANAPLVTTEALVTVASPTDIVTDSVTISGLGSQSATYNWTLYGPLPAINGSCATVDWTQAVPFDSDSMTVPGDGIYPTTETELGGSGCYSYDGELEATPTSDRVYLAPGVPAETIRVDAVTPQVVTEASTNAAQPPVDVTDEIRITGLGDQESTYTWSLLGPVPAVNGSCDPIDWTGVDSIAGDTLSVDGDGAYTTTPATTLSDVGCYTYSGSLAATETSNAVVHEPGDPLETILISTSTPLVTTQALVNSALPGDTVHDLVTATGLGGETPDYDWSLLGPVPAVNGSCDAVDWTGATPFDFGTVTAEEGTFSTQDTELGAAGCYTYIGTLAATASTDEVTLDAGVPEETILVEPLSPEVSTRASQTVAAPGTSVTDSVFVEGLRDVEATYTWTLLGPVPAVGDSCEGIDWTGALQRDNGSETITGDGTTVTDPTTVSEVGCYTYTGTLEATPSSEEVVLGAGIPDETFLIAANTATVVTRASTTSAEPGTTVTDSVEVTGLNGETVAYEWTLVGPVPAVNGSCDAIDWTSATAIDEGELTVVGNGTYQTDPTVLTAAGCYSYTGELAPSATSLGVSLAAGDPLETVLITAVEPTITTQAGPQTGAPGLVVTDTVVLTGPIPAGTVYTWTLYGPIPAVADSCVGLDWSSAVALATSTVTLDGPGTYETPEVTLDEVGCYSYGGSLPATVSTLAQSQAPGVPAETVRIATNLPSVVTTASDDTGLPGDEFSDSIVITGTNGAETTYEWSLVGPVPVIDGSCAAVDWSGADVVASDTIDIDGDDTYSTPETTVDEVGCYTYTGSLAASTTTDAVELAAGDPAETFLIEPFAPVVTTEASASTGEAGDSFTDSVRVVGSGGITADYHWTLVQAEPDGAGTCQAIDWDAAGTVIDSGTFTVTGDDTYTTDATVVTEAACYSYTGELEATATSTGVVLAAGDPLETFLIEPFVPGVVTQASVTTAEPGDVVHDVVTIGNFGLHNALYEWTLLGPVDPVLGECSTVSWAGADVFDAGSFTVVPGTAEYLTSESEIGLPGCYTYTGELAATASSEGVVHDAGDPAETVLVTPLLPEVSTQVSAPRTEVGSDVSDAITITGTRGASIEVTWTLYGPVTPVSGSCDTVDWSDAQVAFEGVVIADGDGTIEAPDVTPVALGCYSYETTLAATDTTSAAVHEVGDPSETTHVVPRPTALALTGSTVNTLIGGGAVLFGLGLAALLIARSRRSGRHSTEA